MWVFDVQTLRFLDVNDVALRKYGYSLSEFLKLRIDEIRPPEDVPALHKFLQHSCTDYASTLVRHTLKSGKIIHVSITAYPITYEARQAMVVSARDVSDLIALQNENAELLRREQTARVRAEEAAHYFQSLFETIPGKFLVLTPDNFEIVAVSDAYLTATMRRRDEIKGKGIFDAFPASPDDPSADGVNTLRGSLTRAQQSGIADVMAVQHYPIPRPAELGGGFEDRYWSPVNTPVNGPDGKIAYLVHRVEDVTELVKASGIDGSGSSTDAASDHSNLLELDVILRANELKMARQRTQELADQLTNTLESMSDAFYTLDASWKFAYLNAQAETMLHTRRKELIDQIVWEKFPAILNTQFESQYRHAMVSGQTVRFVEFYPPLNKWFEVNAYPTRDTLAVYFRDITEDRKREEQLRQSQKMEVLGQLTGGIAHDFNNLLTVIMGNTELLSLQLDDKPVLKELAQMATDAAAKGAQLTHHLLAFARQQTLKQDVIEIDRLFDQMSSLLNRALTEKISVKIDHPADLWTIKTDQSQLESAILNIAINARDAMPQGGELEILTANVTFSDQDMLPGTLPAGDYVRVTLKDSGSGIPEDLLSKVFEPFFTTKESGKGSGLGLSMVLGFMQQSKGHVDIQTQPGIGTTLTLYFPRYTQNSLSASQATASAAGTAIRGGTEHILLVEDNELVGAHVKAQLHALGYRVSTASNGPEAIEQFTQLKNIDLLLTDIMMPGGMSGVELAAELRSRRPDLRILFTSGFTGDALNKEAKVPVDFALLKKPFRRAELAAMVRAALDKTA